MEYEDDVLLGSDDYAPEGKRNKRSRNRGIKERKKKEPSLPWSEEDMEKLIAIVRERLDPETGSDALVPWGEVAQLMVNRNAKQCREKYRNDLRPDISKAPWSFKEDYVLALAHSQLGNKWSDISQYLPRRAENTIKNHWYATNRAKGDNKPKTFLWLYSALWEENPHQDCLAVARDHWQYMVATGDGSLPPLEEFEVDINYFTTGEGVLHNAELQRAEFEAAVTFGGGSVPVRSATARAAAISAGGPSTQAPAKRHRATTDSAGTSSTYMSHALPRHMTMPGSLPSHHAAYGHQHGYGHLGPLPGLPWAAAPASPTLHQWVQPPTLSAPQLPFPSSQQSMSEVADASCHVAFQMPAGPSHDPELQGMGAHVKAGGDDAVPPPPYGLLPYPQHSSLTLPPPLGLPQHNKFALQPDMAPLGGQFYRPPPLPMVYDPSRAHVNEEPLPPVVSVPVPQDINTAVNAYGALDELFANVDPTHSPRVDDMDEFLKELARGDALVDGPVHTHNNNTTAPVQWPKEAPTAPLPPPPLPLVPGLLSAAADGASMAPASPAHVVRGMAPRDGYEVPGWDTPQSTARTGMRPAAVAARFGAGSPRQLLPHLQPVQQLGAPAVAAAGHTAVSDPLSLNPWNLPLLHH